MRKGWFAFAFLPKMRGIQRYRSAKSENSDLNSGCDILFTRDTARVIPRCYRQFFLYRYFAGIRFAGFSVFRSVLLGRLHDVGEIKVMGISYSI